MLAIAENDSRAEAHVRRIRETAKKAANLSVRVDLLSDARARKINLSQTLEKALQAELKKQREAEWLEQNREAIEACNREAAEHGLWSDGLRVF